MEDPRPLNEHGVIRHAGGYDLVLVLQAEERYRFLPLSTEFKPWYGTYPQCLEMVLSPEEWL